MSARKVITRFLATITTPAEWPKKTFYDRIHPEDRTTFKLERERARLEDQVVKLEYRIRHGDGHYVWVHDLGAILLDDRGHPRIVIGLLRDVSQLRQAQQQQRETEQAFNASRDLIAIVDADFKILHINQTLADCAGTTREAAAGAACYALAGEKEKCPDCPHTMLMNTGKTASAKIKWGALGGEYLVTCSPFVDQRKKVVGSIHVAHDLTEIVAIEKKQRLLEEKMQQAQKLESLGMLAGGIAHDFNNLLQVILGSATFVRDVLPEGSDLIEPLDDIIASSKSGSELSNLMLAYAGKETVAKEPIDINEIIREVVHLAQSRISEKTELILDITDESILVFGEKGQLRQVLMNPISNAVESIDKNETGKITISTRKNRYAQNELDKFLSNVELRQGDYVRVTITDTGAGMDEATRKQIFDPFFTTKFTGRGMGLASIHGIVNAYGGAVSVESTPRRGTAFSILLPAFDAPKDTTVSDEAQVHRMDVRQPKGNTILFVDDDKGIRKMAVLFLKDGDYRVITAGDGVEGMKRFQENKDSICCVVLDVIMPKMNGREALKEIRATCSEMPAILISGYDGTAGGERLPLDGRTKFLQKPFEWHQLIDKIDGLLSQKGRTAEGA